MDIHVKLHNTEVYKKSVINMGTRVYNNLPGFIKVIDDYKAFEKELKLFLLQALCCFLTLYSFFITSFTH